ncbi:MAG: DUF222 domain-containing protein [Acidimicrobiales bacterium]
MSLLMDAPPSLGVLEALEALPIEVMSGPELGVALRALRVVQGRVDVIDARLVAAFGRVNGAQGDGATDTTSWLADKTKTSGRAAKRRVKRAKLIAAVPALGDALAAGEISAAHVDAVAAIVPAPLLAKAGSLVAAAKTSTPEELAHKAHQLVIENDGDGGAKRALRLKAGQQVRFFDLESGMRALFGEWDPESAAPIERAVDLVANELWRIEHPTRNPTRLDETSLKFRRADAVREIARRINARADAETAAAPAAAAADNTGSVDTEPADATDPSDAAAGDTPTPKPSITSKRVTAKTPRPAVVAVSVLINYRILLGDLSAKGSARSSTAPRFRRTRCAGRRVMRGSSRW